MPQSTYDALFSTTLTSNQPNVIFSGIPQNYKDLILIANVSPAVSNGSICFRVGNGTVDSNSNYSATWHFGTRTSTPSDIQQGSRINSHNLAVLCGWQTAILTTDIAFGQVNIFNYSSSSNFKTMIGQELATDTPLIEQHVTTWRSNSPIDIITIFNNGGSGQLASGSTFSLYGLAVA